MKSEDKNETALIEMPAMNLPSPTEIGEKIHKSFQTIYKKLEQQIEEAEPDVTTNAGREKIASLAYKIARTKTGLDKAATSLTADQKEIIDVVNKERREMRDDLDGLRDRRGPRQNDHSGYFQGAGAQRFDKVLRHLTTNSTRN
ncbi:MAG: hypothetical protein KAT58_04095 [candidate division Zixibacteria bacterium]|nr:hypothetical protein [candidate division Zixibacteria bacterium]